MAPLESFLPFVFLRVSQQQWSHQRVMRGLFIIIKWIDQRSLHVQKCNDRANEIVPLLPSRRSNYIVRGHGGLTAMGRFSMTCSWVCLSRCMRIFHHQIFFYFVGLLRRALASSPPCFHFPLCKSDSSAKAEIEQWRFVQCESERGGYTRVTVRFFCLFPTLSSSVLIDKKMDTICLVLLSE